MRNVDNLSKATDNLMVNDTGGTGKDHVVSAVFNILPEKEKEKRERISPKVLGYLNNLKNNPEGWVKKCLYLEDVPNCVLNDDCFKVMSSASPSGISKSSIIVNNSIKEISIRGKPSIVLTIASASPKQELMRRYPICNLTGTVNQTKAVLKKQALFAKQGKTIDYDPKITSALSHLKRVKVKIPYADKIANIFPAENVIIRTHFPRFLDYIKSSCSLHQYQREKDKEGFYLAVEQDYEYARDVLMTTTSNQLMIPLTRNQKQILEVLEKERRMAYTFQELEILLQHVPLQNRWLRVQLEKLSKDGFLIRGNDTRPGIYKPLATYEFSDINKLEIPKFKDIFNTNTDNKTITTITTNTAYTKEKASKEYLNNLQYMSSEFTQEKDDLQLITDEEMVEDG